MKPFFTAVILVFMFALPARADLTKSYGDPDSLIITALSMVDQDSLYSYVQSLQNMGTRFMIAPNRKEVAEWIMNKFLSFGITDVRLDSFPAYVHINAFSLHYDTTTWQYNVEARIQGTEFPGKEMLMLAHYDDATQNVDPIFAAPGADDNASGTAGLLETARIISQMDYQPRQTMVFLASAAEELMYYGDAGTEHYAAEALEAGRDIVMAINNDMIGWDDDTWTIQLFNHTGSPGLTDLAIEIITNYTTLNYQSHNPIQDVGGDIQPFLDAGYHGIYFMEHSLNPDYHTLGDSIGNLSFEYLAEVISINLGCFLQTDITVNSKIYSAFSSSLKINPNPASDYVIISAPVSSVPFLIRICSLDGSTKLSSKKSGRVDISTLPAGVYLVIITSGELYSCGKLVVI